MREPDILTIINDVADKKLRKQQFGSEEEDVACMLSAILCEEFGDGTRESDENINKFHRLVKGV